MFYILLFMMTIVFIVLMSVFFKPIGSLAIRFFKYLKSIFEEEIDNGKK